LYFISSLRIIIKYNNNNHHHHHHFFGGRSTTILVMVILNDAGICWDGQLKQQAAPSGIPSPYLGRVGEGWCFAAIVTMTR